MDSSIFRDVTILYMEENQTWLDYILKHFRNEELGLKLETLAVDKLNSDNPPELEVAIRESHVVVMLTTSTFMGFMEDNRNWFPLMMNKMDTNVSAILHLLVHVTQEDFSEMCEEIDSYSHPPENCLLVNDTTEAKNIRDVIAHIIQTLETKKTQFQQQHDTPAQPETQVTIVPASLPKAGENVAIVFHQEMEGNVSVVFRHLKQDIACERLNPYTYMFKAPALPGSQVSMKILIDGVLHVRRKLDNVAAMSNFTSVEFLCQTHGVSNKDELDDLLAKNFSSTLCPNLVNIFTDLATSPDNIQSKYKFPTMLHWAAANGLKEFASALLSAPQADLACSATNRDGLDPIDLASENGYTELSDMIAEFIDLDDACNLYVTYCSALKSPEQGQTYVDMNQTVFNYMNPDVMTRSSSFSGRSTQVSGAPMPPKSRPPPLPPRKISIGEATSPKSPDLFFPVAQMSPGAVGSRSQDELIEIQEAVKDKTFSIPEAEMLYRSWLERNRTGNAISFKDRKTKLEAFRKENQKTLDDLNKMSIGSKQKKVKKEKKSKKGKVDVTPPINISDPILTRHNVTGSMRSSIGRGAKTHSNTSTLSGDSGRASNVSNLSTHSMISHSSSSSDDYAYGNRISMTDTYLQLSNTVDVPQQPPPVPPRPQRKLSEPTSTNATPKATSRTRFFSRK